MILKKVSIGIFIIMLNFQGRKNLTMESEDKVLSLSRFSRYLVIVKIIEIRQEKGHESKKNRDLKAIFIQK